MNKLQQNAMTSWFLKRFRQQLTCGFCAARGPCNGKFFHSPGLFLPVPSSFLPLWVGIRTKGAGRFRWSIARQIAVTARLCFNKFLLCEFCRRALRAWSLKRAAVKMSASAEIEMSNFSSSQAQPSQKRRQQGRHSTLVSAELFEKWKTQQQYPHISLIQDANDVQRIVCETCKVKFEVELECFYSSSTNWNLCVKICQLTESVLFRSTGFAWRRSQDALRLGLVWKHERSFGSFDWSSHERISCQIWPLAASAALHSSALNRVLIAWKADLWSKRQGEAAINVLFSLDTSSCRAPGLVHFHNG